MAKINYGIDLGTTNSSVARMEGGRPVIQKIEVTDDTMPSCVFFHKNRSCYVGQTAYNSMKSDKRRAMRRMDSPETNAFLEFKRTMGTDRKYVSPNMDGREYSSEELSAQVLKALKASVPEDFRSAVITVPAKFTVNQKTATIEAARMAGFDHVELLQEPIAAAMAYGLTVDQTDGYWLVFDFGGGTFDAALINVEDGIIQVTDTEGDNYLGGKNLDYAIVDRILIPYLKRNYSIDGYLDDPVRKEILREAMKTYAEEVKNRISSSSEYNLYVDPGDLGVDEDGEEIEIDLTVRDTEVNDVMRPLFQRAVDLCLELLRRNNLTSDHVARLILVGGPTQSPLIRKILSEQVSPNVDTGINPMTAVAAGAAIYASTLHNEDEPDNEDSIDDEQNSTPQDQDEVVLDMVFESMTVDQISWIPVSVKSGPDTVTVQFVRDDNAWDSGKTEIDRNGNIVELSLLPNTANTFDVLCFDATGSRVSCQPDRITIIQGARVGSATLPYDISLAVRNDRKGRDIVAHVRGLERNKTLPAVGVINGLHTNVQLHPGNADDVLRIPIYQADQGGNGKSARLFELVGEVLVSGADVDVVIPKNANVDIIVKVDRNEQMSVEVYFPELDVSVNKRIDTLRKQSLDEASAFVDREMPGAQKTLRELLNRGYDVSRLMEQLDNVAREHSDSTEPKMVMQHLKEVLRRIEDFEDSTEWMRVYQELQDYFSALRAAQTVHGDAVTQRVLQSLQTQFKAVVERQNVNMALELLNSAKSLYFRLCMLETLVGRIRYLDKMKDSINWTDHEAAMALLAKGVDMANSNPSKELLMSIVLQLDNLIPDDTKGYFSDVY